MKRRLRQLKACCFARTVPDRRLVRRSSAEGEFSSSTATAGELRRAGTKLGETTGGVAPPARRLDSGSRPESARGG